MRKIVSGILLLAGISLMAQMENVESGVYSWTDLQLEKQNVQSARQILNGTTSDLESLKVEAIILLSGESTKQDPLNDSIEKIIIVKEGKVEVSLEDKKKILGPGSVILLMPGANYLVHNSGTVPVSLYDFAFKSGKKPDHERGNSSGGSIMIDFEDLEFKPHDKGGIRNYYHQSTAMFEYAEMHVTTLNGNIKSHEPHTHGAAEFVLMISGNSEMQIEDKFYKATAGDLYFLESDVLHAIENKGNEPCMYYAFQWE